ncbi:MAG: NADH-quinone oxidoreductase subunit I [Candidatus Velamenicoccus archaeovorus]
MAIDGKDLRKPPQGGVAVGQGLLKGLGVTLKHMLRPAVTQQYPDVKPDLPARTRGVIALKQANCTVCYKCSRECPDWCIYIDAHKETHPPASGGRARSVKVLDRFDIDYALCMYCGICVEVCPFDALFWSPEFEYATYDIHDLLHDKEKLEEWTSTVLPPPMIEEGAEVPQEVAAPAPSGAPAAVGTAGGASVASASAPAAVAGPASPAEAPSAPTPPPAAPAPAPATEHREVALDQEVFEETLQDLLAKGTERRVAEGQARRAAMIAARKKAEGGA